MKKTTLTLLSALVAALTAPCLAPPILTKTAGTCPGTMTYQVSGTTPGTAVALLYANVTGSFVIPSGACVGTTLGLGASGLQIVQIGPSNSAGVATFTGNAPPAACNRFLQAVDGGTCQTSNVVVIL